MGLTKYGLGGNRRTDRPPSGVSLKTLALIGVLSVLVISGLGLQYLSKSSKVRTDRATLCAIDRPPTELTVILLDISEEFSEPQLIQVQQAMKRLRDEVPQLGRVDVYAVSRNGERLVKPIASLCNPGTGEGMNRLYQNPDIARRKWGEFAETFDKTIIEIGSLSDTATSPIYESVQAVSLRSFSDPAYDHLSKRLVIVSDLLQNMPGHSHYRKIPVFEEFKRTPYFLQVLPSLADVGVEVFYLRRSELAIPVAIHTSFWADFFNAAGATSVRFIAVYGDK